MLTTILTGTTVPEKQIPTAVATALPAFGVVGSVVQLDARPSSDPEGSALTYAWSFIKKPIGSTVAAEGFRSLELDSVTASPVVVSFSPDLVGEYIIGLTVSNGVFSSEQTQIQVSIRAIMVPHARGIVPDGKFIWSYLRDVWTDVDGREVFETFWSALIQILGADLLKLYQIDFNKSIRDIQDQFQRRWLSYEPELELDQANLSFYLGDHLAGLSASTVSLGLTGEAVVLDSGDLLVVSGAVLPDVSGSHLKVLYAQQPGNILTYLLAGTNFKKSGYKLSPSTQVPNPVGERAVPGEVPFYFTNQSTTWSLGVLQLRDYALTMSETGSVQEQIIDPFNTSHGAAIAAAIQVGDVIVYKSGPNAGVYRIIAKSGSFFTVDHAPSSFSDVTTSLTIKADVYRPIGYSIDQAAPVLTDTMCVPDDAAFDISKLAPGRIVVMGGQAFTLLRTTVETSQRIPLTVLTMDESLVPTGLTGQAWRTPHTLVSETQDFEALGVASGDLLLIEVTQDGSQTSVTIPVQVIGVDRKRLGFVLTTEPTTLGVIPPIPDSVFAALANGFNIPGLTRSQDGSLHFDKEALQLLEDASTVAFSREFWNVLLTPSSEIYVTDRTFRIRPRAVIRNRMIPVDETLLSVPALQDWIVQPQLSEHDGGVFQVLADGTESPIQRKPFVLIENSDYIIDGDLALDGSLTFASGSNIVESDSGDFIDRNVSPGDTFFIVDPITLAGPYNIISVLGPNKLLLNKPIPSYVLGNPVTARVRIERKRAGHFLRFVPGGFSAQNPAPKRLWGEVSLFDNGQNIENNFGILVGLKREDLNNISASVSYRQAVAGLMFAFTKGSTISKIRLGVQILLGLPFAEHRGIVRSIENDYRLDGMGNPVEGRILVEDIDDTDVPLGTQRVYLFPIDPLSDLAGLEVNPATKKLFAIGDKVELFQALSKGAEVDDYITTPGLALSDVAKLQQFHSFRLRVNDTVFSLDELSMVSSFVRKITPSYVAYVLAVESDYADDVHVLDAIFNSIRSTDGSLVDNASFAIPSVLMFDSRTFGLGLHPNFTDLGICNIRAVGQAGVLTASSSTLSSPTSHFLNPPTGDKPLVKVGDKIVILSGTNAGIFTVGSLTDTSLTPSDGPAFGFADDPKVTFFVGRPVTALLRSGSAAVTSGNALIVTNNGLRADLVAPNDLVVIDDGSKGRVFKVVSVGTDGGGNYNQLTLNTAPTFTGTRNYRIYRDAFLGNPYRAETMTLSVSAGVPSLSDRFLQALLEPGDSLLSVDGKVTCFVFDGVNLAIDTIPPNGSYTVMIAKRGRRDSVVGFDHLDFDPFNHVEIALHDPTASATCTATSPVVSMTQDPTVLGVRPGDLLQLMSGGNSTVDVGYGPGFYPIRAVSVLSLSLTMALTAGGTASWKIWRRR